ncbi:MAG: hypothetical protein V4733_08940 [Verrucomicrobiota bacterium]
MKIFALLALAACAVAATSCNSVIGLGRDMRIAGEGMEKASNKVTRSGGGGGGSYDSGADTSGAPIY